MEPSLTAPQVIVEQTGSPSDLPRAFESSSHTVGFRSSHSVLSIKGVLKVLCSIAVFGCIPYIGLSPALAGILDVGEMLERGDRDPKVGAIQRQLNEIGLYNGPISDFYGDLTEAAVANYQRSINLTPDGVFGAQTDNALFDLGLVGIPISSTIPVIPSTGTRVYALGERMLQLGDQGQDVRDVQTLLNNRFAPITIDGVFGPQTDTLVRNFQRQYGLTADGTVGPATLNALRDTSTSNFTRQSTSTQRFSQSDAGRSPEASNATFRAAIINQGPYIVVIPADSDDREKLNHVRDDERLDLDQACMARSRRGSYIFAGGYPTYSSAESMRLLVHASRPSPNTPRLDARVDYRGDDFTVECLY